MKENDNEFQKSYVALPLKEGPLFSWIESLNPDKPFLHMTFYFLGTINVDQLNKIKPLITELAQLLKASNLKPRKLDIIGEKNKSFVLLLDETDELKSVRNVLETEFPEFKAKNLPFAPHITIKNFGFDDLKLENFNEFKDIPDKSRETPSFSPSSIGVYYKIDGATALLFSRRI